MNRWFRMCVSLVCAVAVAVGLSGLTIGAAHAADYNGTVTDLGNTYWNQWSFSGPNGPITATLSSSSATHNQYPYEYFAPGSPAPGQPMEDGTWNGTMAAWGATGDYSSVYTPTNIKSTDGVTVTYLTGSTDPPEDSSCDGVTGPTLGQTVMCNDADEITIDFSHEVTDATLHVMNLGGIRNAQSAWVELTNTSGQTLRQESKGGNFQVVGNKITTINPVEVTSLTNSGTGSGSVTVEGTYTSLTFKVDLAWYGLTSTSAQTVLDAVALNWTLHDDPPPADGDLVVAAAPASKKLPVRTRTVVVSSAEVEPSDVGRVRSIAVSCRPASSRQAGRGDVRYCRYTKNLRTGRVTVTPLRRGIKVKVTIRSKSTADSYTPQVWKRTWRSR